MIRVTVEAVKNLKNAVVSDRLVCSALPPKWLGGSRMFLSVMQVSVYVRLYQFLYLHLSGCLHYMGRQYSCHLQS